MSTKKKVDEKDQPNLFGKIDETYNTISLEVSILRDEISAVDRAIEVKEEKKDELEKRFQKMSRALRELEKAKEDLKPKEKKDPPKKKAPPKKVEQEDSKKK